MAGLIGVKVNFDPLLEGVGIVKEQVPFAIARTLTKLAQAGQFETRREEERVFRLRNDWTQRNTKIKPATKENPVAEAFTYTANRQTGAPDYLPGQEDGAERVPINGRHHIAIPTKYLRQLVGGDRKPIPEWLRPKALLGYAASGGKYATRRGKMRGNAQTRGYYFFLVTFKSGSLGIMARAVGDAPNAALPMYIFVTRAHIRKRLHMQEDVEHAVQQGLEKAFSDSITEIKLNEALRGTGLSVRF